MKTNGCHYRWILADIKPVFEGIHCWRVNAKHKQDGGWIVYGVSSLKLYEDNTFGQKGVWGITYNSCWYGEGEYNQSVVTDCQHFHQREVCKLFSVFEEHCLD